MLGGGKGGQKDAANMGPAAKGDSQPATLVAKGGAVLKPWNGRKRPEVWVKLKISEVEGGGGGHKGGQQT